MDDQLPPGFQAPLNPSTQIKAVAWAGQDGIYRQLVPITPKQAAALHESMTAAGAEPHGAPLVGTLTILFTSGGAYRYQNVPVLLVEELLGAERAGKFFHMAIRGKAEYPAEKVVLEGAKP